MNSHKDINNMFKQFYQELYTSQCKAPCKIMNEFLDQCNLPMLEQKDRISLDAELSELELTNTIRSLKNGKSLGPDGICNEFYKKFSHLLTPYLLRLFNKALEEGNLPNTMNEASDSYAKKRQRLTAGWFL